MLIVTYRLTLFATFRKIDEQCNVLKDTTALSILHFENVGLMETFLQAISSLCQCLRYNFVFRFQGI